MLHFENNLNLLVIFNELCRKNQTCSRRQLDWCLHTTDGRVVMDWLHFCTPHRLCDDSTQGSGASLRVLSSGEERETSKAFSTEVMFHPDACCSERGLLQFYNASFTLTKTILHLANNFFQQHMIFPKLPINPHLICQGLLKLVLE